MSSAPGSITTLSTRELVTPQEMRAELDIDVRRVLAQTRAIKEVMTHTMIDGVHYGVIDGTDKPTLYQPGADKLCMLFRLRARYRTKIIVEPNYISVISVCRLYHIGTGEEWGEGQGWANSREEKYVNQTTMRSCPTCKKQTVFRSKKAERDGSRGWFCWAAKGGCGLNFAEKDPAIVDQGAPVVGDKVHNLANTILKIANKRSKTAAILTATGAADVFGQDLEDLDEAERWLDDRQKATTGQPQPAQPAANGTNGSAHPAGANGNGNGNGAQSPSNGVAAPAANGGAAAAPASNGNGVKRAGPLQIRDLTTALRGKLQVTEPERQIAWCNGMLPEGRKIAAFNDLTPDETVKLTKQADNGEVPGGAEK